MLFRSHRGQAIQQVVAQDLVWLAQRGQVVNLAPFLEQVKVIEQLRLLGFGQGQAQLSQTLREFFRERAAQAAACLSLDDAPALGRRK